MSDRYDIIFETGRFNLTQRKPHYINDCCYGDDVATWLREKLVALDIPATEPGQEDWGWYTGVDYDGVSYFVGISGDPLKEGENNGIWRLMVQKHRSVMQKLTGANKMTEDDELLIILHGLLATEQDIKVTGIE